MQVEFDVESCRATGVADDGCIDTKRISLDMPFGGYVIYGVAHQHAGGSGSALYREVFKCFVCSLHFCAIFPPFFQSPAKLFCIYIESFISFYSLFIFFRNFHLNRLML